MLATTHAIVAGTIASQTQDLTSAVSLSFISHFMLDAIPHWDIGTDWRTRKKFITGLFAILDTLVGFILGIFLFHQSVPLFILIPAIAASMLPDWLEVPWYIFFASAKKKEPKKNASFWEKLSFRIYKTENTIHAKTSLPLGFITQLVVILFFLVLLK